MIIWKCLALYFHRDLREAILKRLQPNVGLKTCQRRESIAHIVQQSQILHFVGVVSHSFFAHCRYVQVVLGCVLLIACCFRSFLTRCRSFSGRFSFVIWLFRSLQFVSGGFLLVVGCCRLFQVVPRFSKYPFRMPRYQDQFFTHLFFKCFAFLKFTMPSQMSGNVHNKKTVLIKLKLKAIDKKA